MEYEASSIYLWAVIEWIITALVSISEDPVHARWQTSLILLTSSSFQFWSQSYLVYCQPLPGLKLFCCTYMAFQSLMLLFKSERYSSFFCSSEDFPFFISFILSSTFLGQIGMVLTSFVWKSLNMGFPICLLGLSWVNWLYSSCKACIFSVFFFGLIVTMLAFPKLLYDFYHRTICS